MCSLAHEGKECSVDVICLHRLTPSAVECLRCLKATPFKTASLAVNPITSGKNSPQRRFIFL